MCTYVRVVCGACMRVLVCVCVARRELLHRKSFSSLASLSRTKQKGSVWNGSLVPPRQQSWNMNTMCDPLEDVSCLQQALSRLVRGHAHMASVCLFNPWEWCKECDDVFCGLGALFASHHHAHHHRVCVVVCGLGVCACRVCVCLCPRLCARACGCRLRFCTRTRHLSESPRILSLPVSSVCPIRKEHPCLVCACFVFVARLFFFSRSVQFRGESGEARVVIKS